jgi:hypothetical protein
MKVLIDGRPSGAAALGSARAPLEGWQGFV